MCLLHTHPITTEFDRDDIADFYKHNSDGVGVMWAEDGELRTIKALPKNADEAWMFYNDYIKGKDCVVHWRMKTHGLIDMINCHPYEVMNEPGNQVSIMHNGVLGTGNAKDVSKSDTWHYVKDWVLPILQDSPWLMVNPVYQALVADHIGHGNRFVLMNQDGATAIINEQDFVTYKGALLSNTYAWDSAKGGFGYKATGGKFSSRWGNIYDYDDSVYYPGASQAKNATAWIDDEPVGRSNYRPTEATEFFNILKQNEYHRAFTTLTYIEVQDAVDDCGPAIWDDFIEVLSVGEYFTDKDVINCIQDVTTLYELLYADDAPIYAHDEADVEDVAQLSLL